MASERRFDGATLQEALDKAAAALGIPEPDLHYRVLETGRKGLFGIGAKAVEIAVEAPERPRRPPRERAASSGDVGEGAGAGSADGSAEDQPSGGRRGSRRGGRGRQRSRAEAAPAEDSPKHDALLTGREEPVRDERAKDEASQLQGERRGRGRGRGGRERGARTEGGERTGRERGGRRRRGRRSGGQRDSGRRQDAAGSRQERGPGRNRKREGREERTPPPPARKPTEEETRDVHAKVGRMIELLGLEVEVEAHASDHGIRLELAGKDHELLVQNDAEFMISLQFLLNRMTRRAWPGVGRITLACDGFRTRRDQEIIELAKQVAGQVLESGEPKQLDPMNPYERRLVHLTVRELDTVTSRSEGDGFLKQIRIAPK